MLRATLIMTSRAPNTPHNIAGREPRSNLMPVISLAILSEEKRT